MSSQIIQAAFRNGFGPLQRKPGQPGGSSENFAIAPGRLNLTGSVGRAMPETVLRKMEQVFKADFSDVRIYQGPQAGSIGAHAFTMGSSIYFAPGQYSPDTARGQQLLGHELAHVLQQRSGRVRAPQGGGMVVVNVHALEAEADRMGVIAASFRPPMQAKMAMPGRPSVQAKPASHRLVIGAYMHQGASGAGAPPDLAGHAFVSVQGPTGKRDTWGFSPANYSRYNPQKDIGKLRAGVPGMVHRDDQAFSKPGVKTRSYNLTPAQAKAAMAKIDEYKTRQYKFSAQSRQCTTFASDVMRAAHVDGGTFGKSPGEMYRSVRDDLIPRAHTRPAARTDFLASSTARYSVQAKTSFRQPGLSIPAPQAPSVYRPQFILAGAKGIEQAKVGYPFVARSVQPLMLQRRNRQPFSQNRQTIVAPASVSPTTSLIPLARPRTRQFLTQPIQRAALPVPEPLFDEEELAEMAADEDYGKVMLKGASAENKKHFATYFATYLADIDKKKKWKEVLATRRRGAGCVSWDFDEVRYHINLRTDTYHVTQEQSPKAHYFFKGTGRDIIDTRPTPAEAGSQAGTKMMFSALPRDVQEFVKENWSLLLL